MPPPDKTPDVSKSHLPLLVHASVDDAGLSVHAFRVLARICRRWSEKEGCFESAANIAEACRMKRDTVFRALAELEEKGIISRSGNVGQTSRIDVTLAVEWGKNPSPETGRVKTATRPRKGVAPNGGAPPETGHPPPPETGRVPIPPNGTQRDTSKGNLEGKPKRQAQAPVLVEIPDWIDPEAWAAWTTHRREIRKPLTPTQTKGQIAKLTTYRDEGTDPNAVLRHSTAQGWTGLYAERREPDRAPRRNTAGSDDLAASYARNAERAAAALGLGDAGMG